jgi:NAD(P)-dependent dehydrogenase (short-subunit alcohol dehydrogenase family)
MVDIRDEERVAEAVRETADKFGGIDILINGPSYSGGHGCCAANDLNEFVADLPTGVRADRRPPSRAALGAPMAPITSGTTTRGAAH